MATRRRRVVSPGGPNPNSPAQQDEADILEEVGAVRDDERGELLVEEDQILKIGAVDAESVIENRRLDDIVKKKRAGVADVAFNAGDMISKYDLITRTWPPNTLYIYVRRLTGQPVERVILTHPRSGPELYAAVMEIHGQYEESRYQIKVVDESSKEFRGNGQITMPDTRPATPQQGQQPMMYPPPGYPPQQQPYPPQQQQTPQAPQTQPAPPVVQVVPQAIDPASMLTMMQSMIGMIDQMRLTAQPAAPQQQPVWQQPPPPPPPQMPAPLAPGASPDEMMTWMQKMVGMVDQMRASAQQHTQAAPQYQPPAPVQPPPPPPSPQSSMTETLTMMEQMFKLFQRMQPPPPSAAPATGQGPYRGPRAPYYPQGESRQEQQPQYQPPQYQPPATPPREKSPQDLMRDAMGTIRMVTAAAHEMQSMLGQDQQDAQPVEADEDAPVRVVDTGAGKLLYDAKDGTLRKMDTFVTALPGMTKWISEQAENFRKAQIDRQAQQRPPTQQLPPGYVEVREGYKLPPGYVAVPVDRLPDPPTPEEVPPPIDSPQEQSSWSWGAPPIPNQGEG